MNKTTETLLQFTALALIYNFWGWGGFVMVLVFMVVSKYLTPIIEEVIIEHNAEQSEKV